MLDGVRLFKSKQEKGYLAKSEITPSFEARGPQSKATRRPDLAGTVLSFQSLSRLFSDCSRDAKMSRFFKQSFRQITLHYKNHCSYFHSKIYNVLYSTKLDQFFMSLPGINALTERVFSIMNNIWTNEKTQFLLVADRGGRVV